MKTVTLNNTKLNVKVANSASKHARGLMYVTSLPEDEGMLFCYPKEKLLKFWMKNTLIPLSIAFIDKNKKIIQIESMKPGDISGIQTISPAKWALEVNAGWFKSNNIKVGDEITIPNREILVRITK